MPAQTKQLAAAQAKEQCQNVERIEPRAVSFFLANLGWSLGETSTAEDRHHWAVVRTSSKPDTRPFDYFAGF